MANTSTLILGLSLVIIMFGMGLSLVVNDFKRVFTQPKAILTGLFNQLILLPVVGFVLISTLDMKPEIAIGLIILAACPGGTTSNLITHLAKGDLALSVSLTAVSSLVTLITIPFIVNLGIQHTLGQGTVIQLDITQSFIQIFAVVAIPIGIGMIIRAKRIDFALRMEKPVRIASALVFILVIIGILVKERENIMPYFQQAGLLSLVLNITTMALGFLSAKVMNLKFKQGVSIAIESGIQNGTLGIAIATVMLSNSSYAIAPAVYGLLMFFTGSLIILWSLNRKA